MSNELAVIEPPSEENALANMQRAEKVAEVCKAMIEATAVNIQGKKYPPVECWQAIANAHGCVLSATGVEKVEGGYKAIGEVRRANTGEILATAEGFVGDDEKTWASRAEYAKRAMAQTRAMSRAGRSAFAYIAVLAKIPNLKTTPAEEVPHDGFDSHVQQPQRAATPKPAQQPAGPDLSFDMGELPTKPDVSACSLATGTLEDVEAREGKDKKGKPWLKFGCKLAGKFYSTFDKNIGQPAGDLVGSEVRIFYKESGKFNNLEWIELA